MSLAKTTLPPEDMSRYRELEGQVPVMSGLNPRQAEELGFLDTKKWLGVDMESLLTEWEDVEVRSTNRKDPYEQRGYEFVVVAELDGLEYVFTGEYDMNELRVEAAELRHEVLSDSPDERLGNRQKLCEYLETEVNHNLDW